MVRIVSFLSGFVLWVSLGLIKFGPMYLLVSSNSDVWLWGIFSLLFSIPLLWNSRSLRLTLLCSGLAQFWFLSTLPTLLFSYFYTVYILSLLLVCCSFSFSISPLIALYSLAGLPPFPLFLSKVIILFYSSFTNRIALLLLTAISLHPYLSLGLSSPSTVTTSFSFLCLICFAGLACAFLVLPFQ
jgi:hypothetical protein